MKDVVIGVDASTTAVKAIAFDRSGRELFQARHGYPLSNPAPGHFEQDPERLVDRAGSRAERDRGAVRGRVCRRALHRASAGDLHSDRFREEARCVPAILWLDERARPQVARLVAGSWDAKRSGNGPASLRTRLRQFTQSLGFHEHRPDVLRESRGAGRCERLLCPSPDRQAQDQHGQRGSARNLWTPDWAGGTRG